MEIQDDPVDDPDILKIDLGLDSGEPDTIDYFTGFENRAGFKALRAACRQYGLDFQLYCAPEDDGIHADIGMTLWSIDNRPLISCVRTTNSAENSL